MFSSSLAGQAGSALWRQNPMLGLGLAFGVGAGAYAGVHTFAATEGTTKEKAAAAADSGGNYLRNGSIGMAVGLTALPYVANRWTGRTAAGVVKSGPGAVGRYLFKAYKAGAAESGFLGGMGRVAERKLFVAGAGAAIGAAIDQDHPGRGAAIGGGAGLAISAGVRASRLWKGFNPLVKLGAIGVLGASAFGAASIMTRQRYAVLDQAVPEDSGLRDRMGTIGAGGDLVFGLHNSR